ncbi:protein GPR108-like isoform X2 [Apostichopus japonicus]
MKSFVGTKSSLIIVNGTDCSHKDPPIDSSDSSFHIPLAVDGSVFSICVNDSNDEGQYTLFFQACHLTRPFSFEVSLTEMNPGPNYLPSGEMALPAVYGLMSIVFGASGLFWIVFLCRHEETVFKIHYLMFVLVLLKTLSLFFHSVDYYFIATEGSPMQAFALLFYITYLTKGALLFSTLALVGSGWAFIKPVLADKEKKIFLLVIPLQILANVAFIITETTEEGDSQYGYWKVVFVGVDIICCVAIMYPVVWSIRHLQSAATTDGKVAITLRKLHLFKQFYIMVVAYFYLTRIISLLLKSGLPPSYSWIHELFFETTTLAFFLITAYRFRPGSDNPYLQLQSEDEYDDDDEEDLDNDEEMSMQSGQTINLIRVNHTSNNVNNHVTNHVT